MEDVLGLTGGQVDFQGRHGIRLAQADVLLQRVAAEAAAVADTLLTRLAASGPAAPVRLEEFAEKSMDLR